MLKVGHDTNGQCSQRSSRRHNCYTNLNAITRLELEINMSLYTTVLLTSINMHAGELGMMMSQMPQTING
jgi:hypothetical protein